ncbi:MAG: AarF/ABC1/UbiB kinase family protein, partial [Dolichospermum sp.]
ERVGLTAVNQIPSATVEQQQTLEYIKRIAGILRETKGFDATKIAPQLAQIIVNPGVQRLGQQIASRVTQKAVTRIIRELLAPE